MDESFAEFAAQHGLVGIGGDLTPATLLAAYCSGRFPWYDEGWPICWWSPDPRAIFEFDRFHSARRLARTIRSGKFQVTVNRAFAGVIRGCADRPLSNADIVEKFTGNARMRLSARQADEVREAVLGLEQAADVRPAIDRICQALPQQH